MHFAGKLILTVLVVLAMSGCTPPEPQIDIEAERAALREVAVAYHDAGSALDVEKLVALYADDALILPPNAEKAEGTEEVRAFASSFTALPGILIRFEEPTVVVSASGDLGYSLAMAELTFEGPDGEPVKDRVRDLHLWRKGADGSWKVVLDIWNSELPPTGGSH